MFHIVTDSSPSSFEPSSNISINYLQITCMKSNSRCRTITLLFKKVLEYKTTSSIAAGSLLFYSFGLLSGMFWGFAFLGFLTYLDKRNRKVHVTANQTSQSPTPLFFSFEKVSITSIPPKKTKTFHDERDYPPIGTEDRCYFRSDNNNKTESRSVFGKCQVFKKSEIKKIHGIARGISLEESNESASFQLNFYYDHKNRAIVQQQASSGCTAAAAAMLIIDHQGIPNIFNLKIRYVANNERIIRDIKEAKLKNFQPLKTHVQSLEELALCIKKNGSAIVSISDEDAGAHSIVVDEISSEGIRLRDPYHGWAITVTKNAFKKRFIENDVIQIVDNISTTSTINKT
jgi:hypothetical protein